MRGREVRDHAVRNPTPTQLDERLRRARDWLVPVHQDAIGVEHEGTYAREGAAELGVAARHGRDGRLAVILSTMEGWMGLLDGKKALIFGVANDHSIAWGIAKALCEQGATLGFSSVERLIARRAPPVAQSIGATVVQPRNVHAARPHPRVRAQGRQPNRAPPSHMPAPPCAGSNTGIPSTNRAMGKPRNDRTAPRTSSTSTEMIAPRSAPGSSRASVSSAS